MIAVISASLAVGVYTGGMSCKIEDCPNDVYARDWRSVHYNRWNRNGDPMGKSRYGDKNPAWTGDNATYRAIHLRLRKIPVSGPCAICGALARHWAYDHTDPNERHNELGAAYSVDLSHYFLACVPCHKRFDITR